jgi:hypothetical protein
MSDTRALSYAQHKSALWNRSGARVHAVVDGLVVPGMASKLVDAEVGGWDCLQRGALSPEASERAAYIVELRLESPFTDWLLTVATTAHPRWGVLMVSNQALLAMRQHCRDLCSVAMPDGDRRNWRWYDPEVLETLLPLLSAAQLDEVFGAGQSMVLPAHDVWTWYAMEQGVLVSSVRPVLAAAAA